MTELKKEDYFNKPDNWFDNSQISDHFRCPSLYMWRWILHLESRFKNINLIFGNACHDGLEHYGNGVWKNPHTVKEPAQLRQEAIDIISTALIDAPEHNKKTATTAIRLFDETINLLETNPMFDGEVTGTESEQRKEILPGIFYFGKIDICIRLNRNQTMLIADYKTKAQIKRHFFDWCGMSRQLKGYLWLTGYNNMAYIVLHCLVKPKVLFNTYNISDLEIGLWESETQVICKDIYTRTLKARNIIEGKKEPLKLYQLFPKSTSKCEDWGCVYQRLCEQPCHAEEVHVDGAVFKLPHDDNEISENENELFSFEG